MAAPKHSADAFVKRGLNRYVTKGKKRKEKLEDVHVEVTKETYHMREEAFEMEAQMSYICRKEKKVCLTDYTLCSWSDKPPIETIVATPGRPISTRTRGKLKGALEVDQTQPSPHTVSMKAQSAGRCIWCTRYVCEVTPEQYQDHVVRDFQGTVVDKDISKLIAQRRTRLLERGALVWVVMNGCDCQEMEVSPQHDSPTYIYTLGVMIAHSPGSPALWPETCVFGAL